MNKILKQIELQNRIKKLSKVNIVTCGNCGSIMLHELDDNEIDCPYCNRIMDVSDCPDYLYDGMENNEVH
jgi:DNA-directed RNA polymerase subunit RPC12/RpoP